MISAITANLRPDAPVPRVDPAAVTNEFLSAAVSKTTEQAARFAKASASMMAVGAPQILPTVSDRLDLYA